MRLSSKLTVIACLFAYLLSPLMVAAERLRGSVIVPQGPDVRRVILRAIKARGGRDGWKWIRRLKYRQRINVLSPTGKLLHRAHELKHFWKQGTSQFTRAENYEPSAPPFIRCLGPRGLWLRRAGHTVRDNLIEGAYLREAFRDFLILSLPHVLRWKACDRVYQGIRPVRGVPCYQILVTKLPGWRTFEDHEFFVSISVDDHRVVALSHWRETTPHEKTDIFFERYKLLADGSRGHTYCLPYKWTEIEPDGTTTHTVLDAIEINPKMNIELFLPVPGKEAGFHADMARNAEHVPADRIPEKAPRKTFFVRPPSWRYYLEGKRQQSLK